MALRHTNFSFFSPESKHEGGNIITRENKPSKCEHCCKVDESDTSSHNPRKSHTKLEVIEDTCDNDKTLKIMHLNIQSLVNKIDMLEVYLSNMKPDVVCLTETWVPEDAINSVSIPGYKIAAYYCRKEKRHGGIIIYCKNVYSFNNIKYAADYSIEMQVECAALQLTVTGKKLIILTAYRPPLGDTKLFFSLMSSLLTKICSENKTVVFCGDLNIDSLSSSLNKFLLDDLFQCYGLNNQLHEPTRIVTYSNGATSSSALDYIVTNIAPEYFNSKVFNPNLSDHMAQLLSIKTKTDSSLDNHNTTYWTRSLNNNNLKVLKNLLNEETWEDIFTEDINQACETFIRIFLYYLDVAAPVKPAHHKTVDTKKWITPLIQKRSRELKDLFKIYRSLQTQELSVLYANKKKDYRHLISATKKDYYCRLIERSDNKTKQIWNIINTKTKETKQVQKIISDEGVMTKNEEIANHFGNHFSNTVQENLANHFGSSASQQCTSAVEVPNSMFFNEVTTSEIKSIIQDLKNKKSSGVDGISAKVLKYVDNTILEPLVYITNQSVASGIFPECLKLSTVIPVFKKGDRCMVENYRPISILSVFSKILEKVVCNKIMNYVTRFNLLTTSQHGFRHGCSTESASFHFINYVNKKIDAKKCTAAVFYDLSKAFDSVNHKFLHDKLHKLGIRGNLLNWIMSFLRNRRFSVKIGNTFSDMFTTDIGVAQGSVLGPLLFLLFINDITIFVKSGFIIIFADDTTIVIYADNAKELENKIHTVNLEVEAWCNKNLLMLNKNKTVVLHFNRSQTLYSTKFLGTTVDNKLNWSHQIDNVCKKVNSAFYAILKMKNNVDISVCKTMYYALVYSHISYNIIVWGNAVNVKRIFILQKKIIRLMYNLKSRESCREIFKKEKLLTFYSIFIYKCAIFCYTNLDCFESNNVNHDYNTRFGEKLRISLHATASYEKSPHYSCIKVFNNLTTEIKSIRCLHVFKNALKSYLIDKCFYSLDEFYNAD